MCSKCFFLRETFVHVLSDMPPPLLLTKTDVLRERERERWNMIGGWENGECIIGQHVYYRTCCILFIRGFEKNLLPMGVETRDPLVNKGVNWFQAHDFSFYHKYSWRGRTEVQYDTFLNGMLLNEVTFNVMLLKNKF